MDTPRIENSAKALTIYGDTTMKLATTRSLVLAIVLLGFLAIAPMAYAVATNHSGAICANNHGGDATFIEHLVNGTSSLKTSDIPIVCPLTRNTSNSNGAWVFVDVFHTGMQTTTCTAFSYRTNGQVISAKTVPFTGSGFNEIVIDLTGSGKSDAWSDYSVFGSIPGNRNGVIYGVDLSEQ